MWRACVRQQWNAPFFRRPLQLKRSLAAAASSEQVLKSSSHAVISNDKRHEDDNLRKVFDSSSFWHSFAQQQSPFAPATGLFGIRFLQRPEGFLQFAHKVRRGCEKIVNGVLQARTSDEYRKLPRKLDLLSDSLCRVLDIADFTRASHPDPSFQQAAIGAYSLLWEYMNILNTTPGLKAQLDQALAIPEVANSWNAEENIVARILLKDFSHSAIDLPERDRQRFVDLSNDVKRLGTKFIDNMAPAESYVRLTRSQLRGMDPKLVQTYLSKRIGGVSLPLAGELPYTALGELEDESVRETIYMKAKQAAPSQLQVLDQLLSARSEIARLSKYDSYSAMNLADKMAQTPEAVNSFLNALCKDNKPTIQRELERLSKLKEAHGSSSPLQPWDLVFYQRRLASLAGNTTRPLHADRLSAYFSVGTVMQGLSRLFDRLYGIRFVPRETSRLETWDPNVRRLDVMHETEGHVAVLYCDLFARADKTPNPAHFTLRCSRQISADELADPDLGLDDGTAKAISTNDQQLYQLPTIALVCAFPHPHTPSTAFSRSRSPDPTLLSFREVQTLFHEMGHAIHSILGRTTLQVVSGTRCATDFAELPSVLMESFASDADVLALFARHWSTDAPLPYTLVQDAMAAQKRGQGMHTETQILYSLLDQAYHSPDVSSSIFNTTQILYSIYDTHAILREPHGVTPQGFFGHLVEYGGTYYSYLFDRAIAGKIWREVFRSGRGGGGVDREAGERFKREVLRWGGARDAWTCIGKVLGDEKLEGGGEVAMREVGRWGVHD